MTVIKLQLAAESHPSNDHHWQFSPECLEQLAEQVKGLPVTVNFEGAPVGIVLDGETSDAGMMLTIDAPDEVARRIASPLFVATDEQWNADYTERVICAADLKGIGLTDD